jgi:hypothetical protein
MTDTIQGFSDPSAPPAGISQPPPPSPDAGGAAGSPAANTLRAKIKDHLRVGALLVFFLIMMACTASLNSVKLGLAVWGMAKLGMGGYIGYWIDRVVFPYARPHRLRGIEAGTSWKRRALIVAASVIAAAQLP